MVGLLDLNNRYRATGTGKIRRLSLFFLCYSLKLKGADKRLILDRSIPMKKTFLALLLLAI